MAKLIVHMCAICPVMHFCHSEAKPLGAVHRIESWSGDYVDRVELHMNDGSVIAYGKVGGNKQKVRHLNPNEYLTSVEQTCVDTRAARNGYLGSTLLFRTSTGNIIPVSGGVDATRVVTKIFEASREQQIVGLTFDGNGCLLRIQTIDVGRPILHSVTLGGFERNFLNGVYSQRDGYSNSIINGHPTFASSEGGFIYSCGDGWMVSPVLPAKSECRGLAHSPRGADIYSLSETKQSWEEVIDGAWQARYGAGVREVAVSMGTPTTTTSSSSSFSSHPLPSWTTVASLVCVLSCCCCSLWTCMKPESHRNVTPLEVAPHQAQLPPSSTPGTGRCNQSRQSSGTPESVSASSSSDGSGSWVLLGGCFVKDTMLKVPDGTIKMVSAFTEGDQTVDAQNGNALRVVSARKLPRSMKDLVTVQTVDSRLVVTADHRVALAGGVVKVASEVQANDAVVCGSRQQVVTKVRSFRMNSECVELQFEMDLPVETFAVPSRGIWTYGESAPLLTEDDDLRTEDGF